MGGCRDLRLRIVRSSDAKDVCGHLLKPGTVYALLAEHRYRLFPDEMFADLFPVTRGRPSVPADVIASVIVLQALEGLFDREAVARLETDIRWKMATGLVNGQCCVLGGGHRKSSLMATLRGGR
jgi:Transposase domain (DUF772)